MAISITLPRRSGQTNPLSSAQWDEVVGIIESAFSQVSTSTGSVTSVNATVPSGLTVSGVPITGAGTIAIGNNLSSGFVKSAGVGFGFTSSAFIDLTSDVIGTLPLANGGTNKSSWTASRIVIVDGLGDLSEADTATYPSLTELSYVKGVTSDIQTQINSKEPTISILPTTKGGTGVNMPSRQDLINYLVDTTSATLNDVLYFDGANLAWTPQSVGTAGIGIGISSGIISLKNGATLTGGSVLYWDGVNSQITQDNSKLFFNGTALGVGTNSGFSKTLNVAGDARFTSNLNSAAQVDIINGNGGNAAVSELRIFNDLSEGFSFSAYSSGYTTIGTLDIASTAFVSSGTLPMNLASDNTTGIKIWSSNGSGTFTEAVKFGNTETVFNDIGSTRNFRIGGDTDTNLLFVNASSDRVGVSTNTPTTTLDVDGTLNATGATTLASTLSVTGATILSNNLTVDTNVLFVDSANNAVAIGASSVLSSDKLFVVGDTTNQNERAILVADSSLKTLYYTRNDGKSIFLSGSSSYSLNNTANERTLTVSQSDSSDTTVVYPVRLAKADTVAGTGIGYGVGLEFNGADYAFQLGSVYSVVTSLTSASNLLSDLVFNTKNGLSSPVERFRVKSTGELRAQGAVTAGNATLSASAIMQADSTTQGFLPPRMTTAQRDAIASPAAGLMIFNTTANRVNAYTGTSWVDLH